MKKVPGHKTDVKDAEWIADLLCHGLLRSSFVPPKPIRELRDLTRYRRKLVESRSAELEIYWAGVRGTMKGHPIEVLVAYGKFEVLEGSPIEGIVIAKFPDVKSARDWYNSEAYQSVAKHRQKGAIYQGLIVEGAA